MRILFIFIIALIFAKNTFSQEVFNYSIKDINNNILDFTSYKGKKILFVLMPEQISDRYISDLSKFQLVNREVVQVIAITNKADSMISIKSFCKRINEDTIFNVVFTEPIFIGTETTDEVFPLLRWLTDQKNNHSFFKNTNVSGFKFLINEKGNIAMVFTPLVAFNSPFLKESVAPKSILIQ